MHLARAVLIDDGVMYSRTRDTCVRAQESDTKDVSLPGVARSIFPPCFFSLPVKYLFVFADEAKVGKHA